MPINTGFRDTINDIIYPRDHCEWDHLGNGSGSYFTTTSIGGVSLANTGGIAGGGCARFENNNAGYWRVNYTDALRLSGRPAWTIDFWINILTDSSSTTNFQISNEGIIIAAGENGTLDSTPAVDYAVTIDADNKLKFYYHDGSVLNVITSTAKIYNNQFNSVKILYDAETIEIYIREELDSSTSFSGNIRNSSGNFVIGGNSNGDYLYSALIDTFSIRRDALYTFNQIDGTLALTPFEQLIEPTNSKSGWDIETLLRFSFNEGAGNTPKPRQLKLIPQTWGNWNYWFVNPKSSLDVTTTEINFDQTITGFKDVDIRTTDGFLCMYGLNDTTDWALDFSTNVHGQDGDINFNNQYPDLNLAIIENFTTTDFNIRLPTRGYLPLEQRTESQTMLDTTKVDSVSANAKYNQGMRPRGLKKIQYKINENSMTEKILARPTAGDRFFIGLPYYEVTTGGTTRENGWWLTDKSISYADTDFRFYANSNIKHISSITKDSANAIIVTTASAHGLTTGDKIMVRPGLVYWSSLSSQSLDAHDFYNNVSGIAYVQVIDSTSVKLFVDSSRTNVKDTTATLPDTQYGYIVTIAADTAEPTLLDGGIKKIEWTKPFNDIISVTSTANVVDYIARTTQNDYTDVLNSGLNTQRNADERTSFDTVFVKSNPIVSSTYTIYPTPAGSQTDPFITSLKSGGFTGTATVCTYVLEGDVLGNGNLKFYVDNVETPDSTTHGIYYRLNRLNGYYEGGTNDDSITYSTGSVGTTYSLPITGESYMGDQHLRNFILFVGISSVVHAASGDRSKARFTVWFESSDGKNDRIFYAGGWQPGRTTIESFVKPSESSSTNPQLFRKRSYVVYETNNDNVDIEIKGIPEIGYNALGQTYIAPDYTQSTMQISGQTNHYDFYTVDETLVKSSGGASTDDIAPWVDQATQTAGQYRLFEGVRYVCLVSHRSSFKFWDDYSLGYWDKV